MGTTPKPPPRTPTKQPEPPKPGSYYGPIDGDEPPLPNAIWLILCTLSFGVGMLTAHLLANYPIGGW